MPRHPVVGPEWIDSAPIQVSKSIEIDAPPSQVWAHVADHEAWPEWFTDLDVVERIGTGEGVGSGRRVTVRRLKLDEEFPAWTPDEQFAFAVIASPFPFLGRLAEDVSLEATDAGTRVTYRQGVEGRRFVGGLMSLAWRQAPRQVERALGRLKQRVESAG